VVTPDTSRFFTASYSGPLRLGCEDSYAWSGNTLLAVESFESTSNYEPPDFISCGPQSLSKENLFQIELLAGLAQIADSYLLAVFKHPPPARFSREPCVDSEALTAIFTNGASHSPGSSAFPRLIRKQKEGTLAFKGRQDILI
jgi:hypothetical protein